MNIDGKPIEQLIEETKRSIDSIESWWQVANSFTPSEKMTHDSNREKLAALKLLQLTEEKRRLLSNMVKWFVLEVCEACKEKGVQPPPLDCSWPVVDELRKKINAASSMEELTEIGDDMAKRIREYNARLCPVE